MHIAICDNEPLAAETLKRQIESLNTKQDIEIYMSIDVFFAAVRSGTKFDLVFMDIEWDEEQNGIDFAGELIDRSPNTQVIYATGYGSKYSQKIFLSRSNLCGFLVKPVETDYLFELLNKADQNIQRRMQKRLLVKNKGISELIAYSEIIFFENEGHNKTIIHLAKRDVNINKSLELLRTELPENFLSCHKSFSVNMDYIKRIDASNMILLSGIKVPVSKARYNDSRDTYFRYMGQIL